jgi:hypothetical protein
MPTRSCPPNAGAAAPSTPGVGSSPADTKGAGSSSDGTAETANVSGAPFPPYQLNQAARESRNADRVPKVPVAPPKGTASRSQVGSSPVQPTTPKPGTGRD